MARERNEALRPRVRAAWAYSGLSQEELAERVGINVRTLEGYLRKSRANTPTLDDAFAIADACWVPRWFIEEGFGEEEADMRERLVAVETAFKELDKEMTTYFDTDRLAKQAADGERRKPPGALDHRASGSDSKARSPKKPRKLKAVDDGQDNAG